MMGNKWVQSSIIFGLAVGIWIGGWLSLIHPLATFIAPAPIGLVSLWIGAKARGTDGWGGPWNGPNE